MRSSHRGASVIAILSTSILVSACGQTPSISTAGSAVNAKTLHVLPGTRVPALPVSIVGADGRRVTVTDVSRIIALTGSIAEVVFSLNLGSRVVARDISTTFKQASGLPVVTRAHDVSAESVLSLRPTVVLADTDTGPPEAIAQLRAAGVPVVILPIADSVADVVPRIHAVANALGVASAGDQLANRTTLNIATARGAVDRGTKKPTVAFLYLRGSAGVYLIGGKGSGADSLIDAAGGVDAGTAMGLGPFTPITSEALIGAQPDVLLLMTDGLESVGGVAGLEKIPGIAQTPAGAHKRVITVEDGVLLNFGPRTAEVITAIASALEQAQ
ncbi:heme/hemin ABC transporter substrate-binding protein [Jatrophihabitans sp. DSM 45814]